MAMFPDARESSSGPRDFSRDVPRGLPLGLFPDVRWEFCRQYLPTDEEGKSNRLLQRQLMSLQSPWADVHDSRRTSRAPRTDHLVIVRRKERKKEGKPKG